MHKLWGGRPLSEFRTGPDGEAACGFVARFARPGGGGWAGTLTITLTLTLTRTPTLTLTLILTL